MGALDETLHLLGAAGQARGHAVDVASRDAVFSHAQDMHRDVDAAHVLVNNAGAGIVGTVEHLSIEQIEWQLQVNPWRLIYGTMAFAPAMPSQRQGCIVDISSVFGFIAFPTQGACDISGFGVRALTECLWRELDGSGVEVVSVPRAASVATWASRRALPHAQASPKTGSSRRLNKQWSRRRKTRLPP